MPILVRQAVVDDADQLGPLIARSWQAAYSEILDAEHLTRGTDAAERTRRFRSLLSGLSGAVATTLVAVDESSEAIAGFIGFGPARELPADLATGEIYALYLDPASWGSGAADELMDAALERLHRHGHASVALWVLADNGRARRFYERSGFTSKGSPQIRGHGAPEQLYLRGLERG